MEIQKTTENSNLDPLISVTQFCYVCTTIILICNSGSGINLINALTVEK